MRQTDRGEGNKTESQTDRQTDRGEGNKTERERGTRQRETDRQGRAEQDRE